MDEGRRTITNRKATIVIIDYGLGNLASVYNALKFLGAKAKISDKSRDAKKAGKLVLPGVGAFRDAVSGLKDRGFVEAIKKFLATGKMYLGICLGLQVLFEKSEEGDIPGLGVFKGSVRRFRKEDGVKVPHIGWNEIVHGPRSTVHGLMKGIESGAYFYFDHSYYADPADKDIIAATTDYGVNFASAIHRGNVYAVQFHPERSQGLGLKLLKNFIEI